MQDPSFLLLLFISVVHGNPCPDGYSHAPNGGDCFQMFSVLLSFLLLLPFANCDICPEGYTQAPCAWDCFQVINFYSYFATQAFPKSFDEVEIECNEREGGMLASIHSQEENDFAAYQLTCDISASYRNLGLKCKGKDCKWDDGTPVTYTNFKDEPKDDGITRCYGLNNKQWQEHDCGEQKQDCWVCRVKARTIECSEGETEYKGGCISVHTTPLDQKTAEASCPGGGHLVSIHSIQENDIYKKAALSAGVNGTIYIGGQLTKGQFEWTDGSYYGARKWANGFPNVVFGSCVQMLLATEFGVQGQWTNIDCSTKQPYMCFRDGANYDPNTAPPHPKADQKCSSDAHHDNGTIYSPNYPLSIPTNQTCEYWIGVEEGKKANLRFSSYDCKSGTTLTLFDGLYSTRPFATFNSTPPNLDQVYKARTNWIRMFFAADETTEGTGWQVEYAGV